MLLYDLSVFMLELPIRSLSILTVIVTQQHDRNTHYDFKNTNPGLEHLGYEYKKT